MSGLWTSGRLLRRGRWSRACLRVGRLAREQVGSEPVSDGAAGAHQPCCYLVVDTQCQQMTQGMDYWTPTVSQWPVIGDFRYRLSDTDFQLITSYRTHQSWTIGYWHNQLLETSVMDYSIRTWPVIGDISHGLLDADMTSYWRHQSWTIRYWLADITSE